MQIDRTGLWIVLALGCAGGLVGALRAEVLHGFYARHERWRDAPRAFVGTCVDATLTGVGLGMAAACGIVALAAVLEQAGLRVF
jgi:hypothetical protein